MSNHAVAMCHRPSMAAISSMGTSNMMPVFLSLSTMARHIWCAKTVCHIGLDDSGRFSVVRLNWNSANMLLPFLYCG